MIQEYRIPVKGIRRVTVCHFSDVHLTEWDALSAPEETEKAQRQTAHWDTLRQDFCREGGEPYGDFERAAPLTHFRRMLAGCAGADALVMAGDILDYVSPANLRAFERETAACPVPWIAVRGNHEKAAELPDSGAAAAMKAAVQTLDAGDLRILAFDDAGRSVTEAQNAVLEAELRQAREEGRPRLLAMHVPIMSPGNEARFREISPYFILNYDGCPRENLDFIALIREYADAVAAVLAGHLHERNVSELCPGVTQYVTSQGIVGRMHRYVIGE